MLLLPVNAHAPRIVELIIEKSFIGAVIGPGGSIIQELQASTNTVINIKEIDDKGRINLTMKDSPENEPLWKDEKGKQQGGGFGGNGGGRDRGPRRDDRRG